MTTTRLGFVNQFRACLKREAFCPGWLGAFSNPFYITRRGLFKGLRELAPRVGGNILDFGCGSKPYEHLFTKAQSYIGVDIAVSGHDHADSKIDLLYDGSRLEFPDGHFDAVVSFEVFEHVFNLQDVINEIVRVTRSSGYLLISIPFAWYEHEAPYDYARYTSYGITHIVKEAGYEVLSIVKTTTFVLALGQMATEYLRRVLPSKGIVRHIVQAALIAPCTLTVCFLNLIFPQRYEYFGNTIILAKKI